MMRNALALALITVICACAGCDSGNGPAGPVLIREGTVLSMQWTDQSGTSRGITRLPSAQLIPGGNGSCGVDATAKVFTTHVEVYTPARTEYGAQIIPFGRIDFVQFCDPAKVTIQKPAPVTPAAPK